MGAIKFQAYPDFINELYTFFRAMAHPARLYALFIISKSESKEVATEELLEKIDLSQSTLSEHLKVLRDTGLVDTKQVMKGNRNCVVYRVNRSALRVMLRHPAMREIWALMKHFTDKNQPIDEEFYSKFRKIMAKYMPNGK